MKLAYILSDNPKIVSDLTRNSAAVDAFIYLNIYGEILFCPKISKALTYFLINVS